MSKSKPRYTNKKSKFSTVFVFLWSFLRFFSVFLLWWNVLLGYLINLILDAVDGDILERLSIKRDWYENWDKWLDLWFYISLAAYIYFNMEMSAVWILLMVLFVYRLIGSILFSVTHNEFLLFIFPNVFTELFLVEALFHDFLKLNLVPTLIILVVYSLVKEWWIHIAKIDLTNLLTGKKKKWR